MDFNGNAAQHHSTASIIRIAQTRLLHESKETARELLRRDEVVPFSFLTGSNSNRETGPCPSMNDIG